MLYKCKYSNGVYSAVPLANMSDNSGGGSSTLSGLDDTAISSPAEGQPLIYDNTASKWKNGEAVIRGTGLASDSGYSNQTVIGKYNKNGSTNLFEVGNGTGTSSSSRYNAFEVGSYGEVVIGGSPDGGGKLFRRRKVSENNNRYPYISGEEFAYWINGSTGTSASRDFKRGELLVFDSGGVLYVVDDGSGSTNLEEVVIHSGDTFVAKTWPHYSSGYNLIPATGFVAYPSAANFEQVGIFNVLRNVWGSLFEKVSNKSNTQVNDSSKYPTSALVYGMNQNLGDPSSASGVTGNDAFSKINTLSSELTSLGNITSVAGKASGTTVATGADFLNSAFSLNAGTYLFHVIVSTSTGAGCHITKGGWSDAQAVQDGEHMVFVKITSNNTTVHIANGGASAVLQANSLCEYVKLA